MNEDWNQAMVILSGFILRRSIYGSVVPLGAIYGWYVSRYYAYG